MVALFSFHRHNWQAKSLLLEEQSMPSQDPREYFGELKEWSERKLNILERYLDSFTKILGSLGGGGQVYYVDAFAGKGIYDDDAKGSALRAAELARKYQLEDRQYRLKCINVEAEYENYENLEANSSGFGDLVSNFHGTFVENLDQILQETANSSALFFLDPFGVKGIDWEAVQKIIRRGFGTDLWIRFDYSGVRRLYGRYGDITPGAEKSFQILCDTYGIQDQEYLYRTLSGETAEIRIQKAIALYLQRLADEFGRVRGSGFAAAYTIKSLQEQGKYSLMFATGHPRGAIIASEVVCGIEETYQRELEEYKASQSTQLAFSFLNPSEEELFLDKVTRLKEDIWSLCQGQELDRTKVYMLVWQKWFGKLKSKHVNEALKALIVDGRIIHASGAVSANYTKFQFRQS